MSLSADKVVAASNAWVWVPDNAATEATPEYLLVRFPDYFDHPLELLRFTPADASEAGLASAVETVLDRARQFGLPDLYWWVKLDSPPEVADLLLARGGTYDLPRRPESHARPGEEMRRNGFLDLIEVRLGVVAKDVLERPLG